MGQRVKYDGFGITELRAWARELDVKGRSKMDGHALLATCRKANDAQRQAKEQALLSEGDVRTGVALQERCGCVLVATTDVQAHSTYGSLYVLGTYVHVCGKDGHWSTSYNNYRQESNGGYRFFLYQLSHAPTGITWSYQRSEDNGQSWLMVGVGLQTADVFKLRKAIDHVRKSRPLVEGVDYRFVAESCVVPDVAGYPVAARVAKRS